MKHGIDERDKIKQVEGAAYEDGRTASIWDTFAHDGSVSSSISSYNYIRREYLINISFYVSSIRLLLNSKY
jgi:beta-glucosidase/6-phospho-beta-glucosidase/beta-galactosidase